MWTLILLHLRQRRSFMIGWSIGVIAMITMLFMVYPSIRDQATALNQALNSLPEGIRSLKSNSSDLLSPVGYMNSQLYYATLPLLFGIACISLGSGLLAKDEQDHTLELLLARPVSRGKLLAAKALAGCLIIGIIAGIGVVDALILSQVVGLEVSAWHLVLATIFSALLPLSFGAIAFAMTASSFARRASVGLAIIIGFGGYLLSSLAGLVDWLATPAKLLPYHYYDSYGILSGHVPKGLVAYLLAIFVCSAIYAWLTFRRRDID